MKSFLEGYAVCSSTQFLIHYSVVEVHHSIPQYCIKYTRRDFTVAREEQRHLYGVKRPDESTKGHESAKKKKKKRSVSLGSEVCVTSNNKYENGTNNAPYKCLLEAVGLGEKKVVISDVECSTSEFHDQLLKS